MSISRRLLGNAVAARLAGVTNATGYYGSVGRPLPGTTGTPERPPTKSADDPRVQPYFILFPGPGAPGPEQDLGNTLEDLDWLIQITAAAGDTEDLLALVDRIHSRLHRWRPTPTGMKVGPLEPPPGYRPLVLTDKDETPHRFFVPLQYGAIAHTTTTQEATP